MKDVYLVMTLAIITMVLLTTSLQAAATPDSATFLAFKQSAAGLSYFSLIRRTPVTEQLDLVIAIASPKPFSADQALWIWWSEDHTLGLFLQEKNNPDRVYSLGTKSGSQDCAARIERATSTDTVISCQGEKSERYPNQKWVYDVRAKSLILQFSYQPFLMSRSFPVTDGAIFVGTDTERLIAVEYKANREPAFRVLSESTARPWIARHEKLVLPHVVPPFPRTTSAQLAAARHGLISDDIQDSIGPWQQDGQQIWFTKNFYDGEGSSGVGGFGYFDLNDKSLHMLQPPEIADWSVSAIDVEPDAVWMALIHNGEYGGSSGGLLRYDRQTGSVRQIAFPDIGLRLNHAGGKIIAATDFGFAVVDTDRYLIDGYFIDRYFIDRTTDGRLRVAAATR